MDNKNNDTVSRKECPDGWWFLFESEALAHAIAKFLDDPCRESVQPYRVFLATLKRIQHAKDGIIDRHRSSSVNAVSQTIGGDIDLDDIGEWEGYYELRKNLIT